MLQFVFFFILKNRRPWPHMMMRRMSKRWEPIRLRGVGECHNMRQGVMGNASIFARELDFALDLAKIIYSYFTII